MNSIRVGSLVESLDEHSSRGQEFQQTWHVCQVPQDDICLIDKIKGWQRSVTKLHTLPLFIQGNAENAEYILKETCGLEEDFELIETNINNLCYTEDTTLVAESANNLQALTMKVNEKMRLSFKI